MRPSDLLELLSREITPAEAANIAALKHSYGRGLVGADLDYLNRELAEVLQAARVLGFKLVALRQELEVLVARHRAITEAKRHVIQLLITRPASC